MARPVVGITSSAPERVQWGVWEEDAVLVPASYVHSVERAGGRPLIVPTTSEDGAADLLELLDGLVLTGGSDVDPGRYGSPAHASTDEPREARDGAELSLLEAALERDMPVLAICRGSQLLNVARGGDLVQHLPDVLGHDEHRHTPGAFADHEVAIERDSRLGGILGERAPVKSHHHQGFGRLGGGLREVAWAEDGIVEAVEDPEWRFLLGVLWHPEEGEDAALFEALVGEARSYREVRRP